MRYPYDAISFFITCDIAFVKNPDDGLLLVGFARASRIPYAIRGLISKPGLRQTIRVIGI